MMLGYTLISYAVKKSKHSKDAEMSCRLVNRRNFVSLLPSHAIASGAEHLSALCSPVLNQVLLILQHDAPYIRASSQPLCLSCPLSLELQHGLFFFFPFGSSSSNCLSKPSWNFDTRAAAGSDAWGSGIYHILSCRPLLKFSIAFSTGFCRVPDNGRGHVSAMQFAISFTLMCCKLPIILFIVCCSKWFRKLIAFCCNVGL